MPRGALLCRSADPEFVEHSLGVWKLVSEDEDLHLAGSLGAEAGREIADTAARMPRLSNSLTTRFAWNSCGNEAATTSSRSSGSME